MPPLASPSEFTSDKREVDQVPLVYESVELIFIFYFICWLFSFKDKANTVEVSTDNQGRFHMHLVSHSSSHKGSFFPFSAGP